MQTRKVDRKSPCRRSNSHANRHSYDPCRQSGHASRNEQDRGSGRSSAKLPIEQFLTSIQVDVLTKDPGILKRHRKFNAESQNDFVKRVLEAARTQNSSEPMKTPKKENSKQQNIKPKISTTTSLPLDDAELMKLMFSSLGNDGEGQPTDSDVDEADGNTTPVTPRNYPLAPPEPYFDFDSLVPPEMWSELMPERQPPDTPIHGHGHGQSQNPQQGGLSFGLPSAVPAGSGNPYSSKSETKLYDGAPTLREEVNQFLIKHDSQKGSFKLSELIGDRNYSHGGVLTNDLEILQADQNGITLEAWRPTTIVVYIRGLCIAGLKVIYANNQERAHGKAIDPSKQVAKIIDLTGLDKSKRPAVVTSVWLACERADSEFRFPIISQVKMSSTLPDTFDTHPELRQLGATDNLKLLSPPGSGWSLKGFYSESGGDLDRLGVIWGRDA